MSFKHNFEIQFIPGRLSNLIICKECPDPEPETCDYVWIDSDGTVYFDSRSPEKLMLFLAKHDALDPGRVHNHDVSAKR